MAVVILKTAQTTNGRIAGVEVLNVENVKQKAKELFFTAPVWNPMVHGTVVDVNLYAKFGTDWVTIEKDEECKLLDPNQPIVFYCHPKMTDWADLFNEVVVWVKKEGDLKIAIIFTLVLILAVLVPRGFLTLVSLATIVTPIVLLYTRSPVIVNKSEPQLPHSNSVPETVPQVVTATVSK